MPMLYFVNYILFATGKHIHPEANQANMVGMPNLLAKSLSDTNLNAIDFRHSFVDRDTSGSSK